jgi:hypothetical protein
MPPPQRVLRTARAGPPPPTRLLLVAVLAALAAPAAAQLLFPFPFPTISSGQQQRGAPAPLVPLSALFAGETEPACIRDAPSSRWAIVAASRDRARPAVFCFTVDCRRYGQSGRCCQWFKNQAECQAALPTAREGRLGSMQEQLACGKRLCSEYGKSGFGGHPLRSIWALGLGMGGGRSARPGAQPAALALNRPHRTQNPLHSPPTRPDKNRHALEDAPDLVRTRVGAAGRRRGAAVRLRRPCRLGGLPGVLQGPVLNRPTNCLRAFRGTQSRAGFLGPSLCF